MARPVSDDREKQFMRLPKESLVRLLLEEIKKNEKQKELLDITVQTKNEKIRNLLDELEYYKKQCGEE